MGKSRFEGMEIAIREQAKVAENGADNKVEIETLEAELIDIDKDTEQNITEIKSTPINKDLLKKKAQIDMDCRLKENERDCKTIVMQAEQQIAQAELDADQAYKQAKLDIESKKASLDNLKQSATEKKEMEDLKANQEHQKILSSVDNVEKTLELQIEKEKLNGEKRKKAIEIKLRSLKARDNITEEAKNSWKQFYDDTVEISKQTSVEK